MAGALLLLVVFRVPFVGHFLRAVVSFGALALCLLLVLQQAPYQPWLSPLLQRSGLDGQRVEGADVQIKMSPDGLYWAHVRLNGYETRMLVDTGATLTALSQRTAQRAGVTPTPGAVPIFARTANGMVQAHPTSINEVAVGGIVASDLRAAISPALDGVDVLGMNFLARLGSWRSEGQTLVLSPHPQSRELQPIPTPRRSPP